MTTRRRSLLIALATSTMACASTQPKQAREDVSDLIDTRAGTADAVVSYDDAESRARVRARVDKRLDGPLTLDGALEIAMLNNRGLQATIEQLGIAQADLVEAGLLENPVVGGNLIVSTKGNGFGGGLSLSQSLLSAFLIPARRRIAKAQLQYAIVSVAEAALELAKDVKIAYADVAAAEATRRLHLELTQAAEVGNEIASRQHAAGNITELDRELFAAALDEARLELSESELSVVEARESLTRLMGLWGKDAQWSIEAELPKPPEAEADLARLESRGIRDRLDVSAARFVVESMERAIELRRRGVVPQIEAGVEAGNEVGNDEGHEWVVGPSLSIELPIFNPGHADFARLRAQLRQAQHQLQQTAVNARSHIREHRAQLITARRKVDYLQTTVLPRRERIGARALERYNGMLIGAYDVIELRNEQIDARHEYVEALREYWTARAELEMAVGGLLPAGG
jgi:cobalt-zinc-cadmium efflux system outer membrane protein